MENHNQLNLIGRCDVCKKPIFKTDDMVTPDGNKIYHPHCFHCKTCNKLIQHIKYIAYGPDYYCDRCYITTFGQQALVEVVSQPIPPKKVIPLSQGQTMYAISSIDNARVKDKLVYQLSVTDENNEKKDLSEISKLTASLDSYLVSIPCLITHYELGVYCLSCFADVPGEYNLNVLYKGKNIFKKVIETNIVDDSILPRKMAFTIGGKGLQNGQIGCENAFTFGIQICEEHDQEKPFDVHPNLIEVYLNGTDELGNNHSRRLPFHSLGPAQYESSYTLTHPGDYCIVIKYLNNASWTTVLNQPILFSPLAGGGYLNNVPDDGVPINTNITFGIHSTDSLVKERLTTGSDDWQVRARGPEKVAYCTVTDCKDGTYQCDLRFLKAGTYTIQVQLRGKVDAYGSPFDLDVI